MTELKFGKNKILVYFNDMVHTVNAKTGKREKLSEDEGERQEFQGVLSIMGSSNETRNSSASYFLLFYET